MAVSKFGFCILLRPWPSRSPMSGSFVSGMMEIEMILFYLLQLLLLEELEQMYRCLRYFPAETKRCADFTTLLSLPILECFFNNEDPKPDFRLSRNSPTVLLNLLDQDRRHGWGAVIETLVFLFWLASGASYRVVSRVFGTPRSTVHCIVHRLTEEVVAIRHKVIHLPKTPEDLEVVSRGFARVLRHSPLYRQTVYPPPGHYILADSGYPCLQRPLPLITPYKRVNEGVAAQRFNSHHSKSTLDYRACPGMMKTRFRAIFLQALEVHHTFVPHVVTACAILHNICLCAGDTVAPEDEPEEDVGDDEGEPGLEASSGALWWDQLSAEVSALEEVPPDHDYWLTGN
ncbi:uncharacterized protein LOC118599123 [Oryzias melastigma]|uniref:uncharacterized protein LOC118599123 n=1 Tax=Oryzias melastigma TaxID=30732 RepID=UPI00168D2F13|nr:uncharacterized protein LOC118599123 [Oryzias melastigma]